MAPNFKPTQPGQWEHGLRNNIEVINSHFSKRSQTIRFAHKWFTPSNGMKGLALNIRYALRAEFPGLHYWHLPQPLLKQTFREVWQAEEEAPTRTMGNRFRTDSDLTVDLFQFWQLASGKFASRRPQSFGRSFNLPRGLATAVQTIRAGQVKTICLNDTCDSENFATTRNTANKALEHVLPYPSKFEL